MVKRIEKYFSWGSVGLLLLTITYTLFQLDEEALWDVHSFRGILSVIVVVVVAEIYLRRKILFEKLSFFEGLFAVVAAAIVASYLYNFKLNLGLSIVLLLFCLGYGIYKRTFYKPHPIMLSLLAFTVMKLLSVLWATDKTTAFDHIDYYCFFLFLPVISCFYRPEKTTLRAFIYIPFFISLLLLLLTVADYIFLMHYLGKPLVSFLTLDKTYLGQHLDTGFATYYQPIIWSITFHPSKIAWGFLVIWTMGYWLWREEKGRIINTFQFLLYTFLMAMIALILQARVTILGIFILISLFVWVSLMKRVKKPKLIALFTVIVFIIGSLITKEIITKTTFFNDEGRVKVNEAALVHFKEHPFIGGGAGYETQLIHSLNINLNSLHNEFLTALSDQGLLGLSFLLLFHVLVIYYGLKNKYFLGIYVLIAFAIFNATEGVMGLPICIPFFLFCLIPPKQT